MAVDLREDERENDWVEGGVSNDEVNGRRHGRRRRRRRRGGEREIN